MTRNDEKWCEECGVDVNTKVIEQSATYTFKGESFNIVEKVRVCSVCGEELTDETLDAETMQMLVKMYMERKGMSFQDIKDVRLQYGLSMEQFAKVLNWSKATIVRYESGKSIPDSSHMATLKKLNEHPEEIHYYYQQNKDNFTEKQQRTIEEKIRALEANVVEQELLNILKKNYKPYEKSIESGYLSFSLEKLIHMILFFTENGVNKTKLMKLMFYSDFLNFKRNLVSISGIPYVRFKHGPVPKDYELILTTLEKNGYIEIDYDDSTEYTYITISSKVKQDMDSFDDYEREILEYVKEYFDGYGSKSISDFSHEEDGWKYTNPSEIISYDHAEKLQLD
ncbi:MAG TPA: type II TA system antitoxin MqsA family protein [Bacillus sp. (in: firmicutes)]|nr:type II TA system antitoxin MqsA family protein [Bacillus sp. (in: firmicutes)]